VQIDILSSLKKEYNNIFIVQNRSFWKDLPYEYNIQKDLVLSFDFGLVNEIQSNGGAAAYFDHIVPQAIMQYYNFETYKFFENWHYDADGKDIFEYRGVDTASAARIELWNEMTYYPRILISLIALKRLSFRNIYYGLTDNSVIKLINMLSIPARSWDCKNRSNLPEYYFPIFRWMNEKVYLINANLKQRIKLFISGFYDMAYFIWEMTPFFDRKQKYVFLWQYYPTASILELLKEDSRVKVVTTNYSWTRRLTKQRNLPIGPIKNKHKAAANEMLALFNKRKHAKYIIEGFDIGEFLYGITLEKISGSLPYYFAIVDSIFAFFKNKDLRLLVTISDIGIINKLMMNYCKIMDIPTYLIINGLLTTAYLNEAKAATFINAYSESIKRDHYRGMGNVFCIGDPRMDYYKKELSKQNLNLTEPTIIIGASGFNNCDLNSYVAVEFDFFNDIMHVLSQLKSEGYKMNIVLKVRANGYISQYRDFMKEYYPNLNIEIYDTIPIKQILGRADLYISIYSQTLFEASCLGSSVLYYRKDTEVNFPPFDNKSELVTASDINELKNKILLFYENDPIYNLFRDREIMKKYVGPTDGKNLERNMNFIYSLVEDGNKA